MFIFVISLTLIMAFFSLGCGSKGEKPKSRPQSAALRAEIQDKVDLYLSLGSTVQDADGSIAFNTYNYSGVAQTHNSVVFSINLTYHVA